MRSLPRPLIRRFGPAAALALTAASLVASPAQAQRIGLEAGLAGVENYDEITPALGVALFLPATERFTVSATYSQWAGCDNNSRDANEECSEPRYGYGNRGVNLLGDYRLLDTRVLSASLGAGMSWYEHLWSRDGETDRDFDEAITFATFLRHPVAYNSSVYLRGDISFPTDDHIPRWGALRLGVDVGIF